MLFQVSNINCGELAGTEISSLVLWIEIRQMGACSLCDKYGAFVANAFDRDTCYIGGSGGEIW